MQAGGASPGTSAGFLSHQRLHERPGSQPSPTFLALIQPHPVGLLQQDFLSDDGSAAPSQATAQVTTELLKAVISATLVPINQSQIHRNIQTPVFPGWRPGEGGRERPENQKEGGRNQHFQSLLIYISLRFFSL